jgi:hypothetical protein
LDEYPIRHFARARREVIDTTVPHEIIGMLGSAVLLEVHRGGTGGEIQKAHPPRHKVGLFDLAAPHGTIDSFLDEIGAAFAAGERQLDVRIAGKKLGEGGYKHGTCHECWHVHPQAPAGSRMLFAE